MDKSYRIHTNIAEDTLLQVNMKQDFDFLEVLSLKLRQKDAYRLHSSNYGVIVGRVLANDAFGIPNAKISLFIERDDNDSSEMESIYPYKEVTSKDKEGRRYNILPDYSDDDCYRIVGTFPNKRLMLDDDTYLEVYDKYWKYTTVTNNAGDYMLFGVPTGSVTVHVDIDLSDIGVLSQKPRDFVYKGYNLSMFDSPSQFKESTNLDNLAQLLSQNRSVFVYPFWGDADNGVAAITRADIQVQYKFEPTCVFMGSIVSDNEGHAIGHKCAPDVENGMNDQLVAGNGTIEMIRKTTDGLVEEYQIQGNQLIDENGVWCYQIPMNLDYIGTDEYGNIVPTDNPNKGIPTRTQVRFRISKNETSDEGFSRHTAKYLVPMNPIFSEDRGDVRLDDGDEHEMTVEPFIADRGIDIEKMYTFGSSTPLHCFRDLYWNNVYSVKNYIPKTQVAHRAYSKNYCALKGSNLADDQNPIPFNKLRIDLPFLYMVVCLIFTMIVYIVYFINSFIICTIDSVIGIINSLHDLKILGVKPFTWIQRISPIGCVVLSAGLSEGNVAYYPGCWCDDGLDASDCPNEMEGNCEKSDDTDELLDKIQRNLAQEFKIVKLDLYQDWINGCLYMPLWYWKKRKKKTFLFFTISSAKNEYCSDDSLYTRLKNYVTCNIRYTDRDFGVSNNDDSMPDSEERWHKNRSAQVRYKRGLIKPVENNDGLTAYYYAALQATSDNINEDLEMSKRGRNFKAVRLFATDIILLGNLNPNNIYGIPQFFKCLPSTTANIPAIATIEEELNPNEEVENYDKDTSGAIEDSGTTTTTGMDWNHDGGDRTPAYSTGLFIDLACTYAGTKPKSCINVERISELGVSIDITHNMAYHEGGDDVKYGRIDADGFISKYELDDMENRAMFATLNHIGFIPQEYQDMHNLYTTQVPDKNTNYLVPKFKYIYPVDFDGRLQLPMDLYNNGFEQALYDEKDESYITFRMGAEGNENKNFNSEGRIRHFYHAYDGLYDMPLYNNSYYFYFGIKKGSTAIDKFNQMFYAPCYKNDKLPFTLDIETQGRSYCPDIYVSNESCSCPSSSSVTLSDLSENCRYAYGDNKNHAYGYIKVSSDDIRKPYSYRLLDKFEEIIIEEHDMTADSFVIGGQIDNEGNVLSNCNGWIFTQRPNNYGMYERIDSGLTPYYSSGLTNQEYTLEVADSDGKTIAQKVKLSVPKISATYTAIPLGTKFYNSATTRIDYICHDDNMFYGQIEMTDFSVDGYKCRIREVESLGYKTDDNDDTKGRYTFCVTGSSNDISDNVIAYIDIYVYKSTRENLVRNCLCDKDTSTNLVAAAQSADTGTLDMSISRASERWEYFVGKYDYDGDEANGQTIGWFIYQPNKYLVKITQGCTSCSALVEDNSSEEIINIMNGTPFMTMLNGMPTKFMLGTANDTNDASIANKSYFYKSQAENDSKGKNISGWYGLHQEDSYMFSRREENRTYNYNQAMWDDFYSGTKDDIASPKTKRSILKFKFDKMFSLAEAAYVTEDSSCRFRFESRGGISPILYRMVTPIYNNLSKANNRYLLRDAFNVQAPSYIPNIIPDNNGNGPVFNPFYENREYIGNYFAAFTRDGSYITKRTIDGEHIKIDRSPSFASISPINDDVLKLKGKDVEGDIDRFSLAHSIGGQHLDGDIERQVQPYLRALYVDRRLGYDFVVMSPAISKNFSLYTDSSRNRVWKGGRISGWTYNGIEMAYDEDYNIISAHTISGSISDVSDIEYSAATFNNRLEYTYKYDCGHKCLTCGFDFTNIRLNESGEAVCPNCGGTNIRFFHGEIGTPISARTKDGITYYEMGEHEIDANTGYALDDAITYYHRGSADSKWGAWNVNQVKSGETVINFGFNHGYDEKVEVGVGVETVPLIKEFYESTINGIDLRHLYWSSFNEKRLNHYTTSKAINQQLEGYGTVAINHPYNPFYVYHYPYEIENMGYNGDFNREDVIAATSAYPTKRFIDVGNLPQTTFYDYETSSCSYGIKAMLTSDGEIRAITKAGEGIELDFEWSNPISVITPNASSKDYANITYLPVPSSDDKDDDEDYIRLDAQWGALAFRIPSYTSSGFNVYTKTPRLIQVLPYFKEIDGIGYIKTCNPSTEFGNQFGNQYGDGQTLDDAIETMTLDGGKFESPYYNLFMGRAQDIYLPEGVDLDGDFFVKDDERLVSDDDDFNNIIFEKNNINLKNTSANTTATVFTVLVDREYEYEGDSNLARHVRTIQTSDLFDCRPLLIKISVGTSSNPLSYVEMRKGGVSAICGTTKESIDVKTSTATKTGKTVCGDTFSYTTSSTEVNPENVPLGEDSTKIYTQTLTFDMKFDTDKEMPIELRQNESFANYDMMSYVFRFTNQYDEQFDIVPSKVEMFSGISEDSSSFSILRFTLKWPVNMGIIADPQWTDAGMGEQVPVEIFARTPSNFIYRLANLNIGFCCCNNDKCGQRTENGGGCSNDVETDIKVPMLSSPDNTGERHTYLTYVGLNGSACN